MWATLERMSRVWVALALGAVVLSSVPAMADDTRPPSRMDERDAAFPMPAAQYKEHVARHLEKARGRLEEHITAKQLPQDKADALRAQFREAVARVNARVDEVCSDGTVTKDEADAVHELAHTLLHRIHKEER